MNDSMQNGSSHRYTIAARDDCNDTMRKVKCEGDRFSDASLNAYFALHPYATLRCFMVEQAKAVLRHIAVHSFNGEQMYAARASCSMCIRIFDELDSRESHRHLIDSAKDSLDGCNSAYKEASDT